MPAIELKDYTNGTILKKLKCEQNCPKMLLTIVDFAFSDMIQNLMHQLDLEYESKCERPAYPRTLISIVVLYYFSIIFPIMQKWEKNARKINFF